MLRGVIVFAVTYLLVATRRVRVVRLDRPAGALVGAVLAVALGALTPEEAARAVDTNTIVLLFAVMGMGAFLELDGFFTRAGRALLARFASPKLLVGAIVWGAGGLSAVVTNDAVCVLAAPLVVSWIERHRLPRLPLLLALATGANTGSVATLVGNPQNMLCGSLGGLAFGAFALRMIPVALVALAVNHALLLWVFRAELAATPSPGRVTDDRAENEDARVLTRRSALTLAVIFGTVAAYTMGGPLAFTALGGFVLLMLLHREDPAVVWRRIDWSVLLFFGGLFVAVDAFARSGVAAWFFARAPLLGDGPVSAWSWLRASGFFLVGSNVVTNVPFILVVRAQMEALPDATLGWELLAMASTFAGNLTLLGSVANVIVAEKAEAVGGLRFGEYLRLGLPLATITTALGALMLLAMHGALL